MSRRDTLVFLVREGEVLLAMKKRGFGEGWWNGAGGKVERGETVFEAAVRETEEEIGVTPKHLWEAARLNFFFPGKDSYPCHVYLCDDWHGEPTESEEMAPRWFKVSKVPYDQMWDGDEYWMPAVFRGEMLEADLHFDMDNKVTDYERRPFAAERLPERAP